MEGGRAGNHHPLNAVKSARMQYAVKQIVLPNNPHMQFARFAKMTGTGYCVCVCTCVCDSYMLCLLKCGCAEEAHSSIVLFLIGLLDPATIFVHGVERLLSFAVFQYKLGKAKLLGDLLVVCYISIL